MTVLELDSKDKFLFPAAAYNQGNNTMICVNIAFIPFFRRFFSDMQQESHWSTRDDWWHGYQAFAELEEMLMGGCVQALIESNERLYRLIDTSLNGTEYTADTTTGVITPALATVPPVSTGATNALRAHVGRLWQLAENSTTGTTFADGAGVDGSPALTDMVGTRDTIRALQGIINAGWFGIGGQPATIADIINALRIGSAGKKTSLLDTLSAILSAGSDVAAIFNLVENLLGDSVTGIEEGAIVAVLIASTMAQVSTANVQYQQLQRLITSLDGGATPAPTTNVLADLDNIAGKLV